MAAGSVSTTRYATSPWTPAGCYSPSWSPWPASADRDAAHRLLTALRAKFSTTTLIWADGGYAGRLVTWATQILTLALTVTKRSDNATGFHFLRRWVVERAFAWLSKYRRCVRDYETRPEHHEAMIYIAMIMSRRLTRQPSFRTHSQARS